jgi:mono/diheme cytochrome c family protein
MATLQILCSSPPAPTLTQLQATIFGPICSTCHTAGGDAPNLSTTALTHSDTVGVASTEQSAVLYIAAGDPDNSYLVRKIEGAALISGVRMPPGGPYLSQAQIDDLRAWVAAGAPNN